MKDTKFTVDQAHDCDSPEEAIGMVEKAGQGSVVLFHGSPNRPGCLPDIVWRSCAMWSFQNGEWWSHYIFDGRGDKVAQEKPHR
jgi:hypothetical protein